MSTIDAPVPGPLVAAPGLTARTLCEAFQQTVAAFPDAPALSTPGGHTLSWSEYGRRVKRIAAALAARGVRRGGAVACMLTNRAEMNLVDVAAIHLGATPFSVYNTLTADQIAYQLRNAAASLIVCEDRFLPIVTAASADAPALDCIVLVDGGGGDILSLADLESDAPADFDLTSARRSVTPGDIATLVYTSGTTGPPKGVELSHASLLANIALMNDVIPFRAQGRLMSYLPSAHLSDRWLSHYVAIVTGACTTSIADASQAVAALPDVRPTGWAAVPRIWEKLRVTLETEHAAQRGTPQGAALDAAMAIAKERARRMASREPVSLELARRYAAADTEVLKPVRASLGLDDADFVASGAAPIADDDLEFFQALGLPIIEVWGMTEVSCIATAITPDRARPGTVGVALPHTEVRRAEDGELLIRGPHLMTGYRAQPKETAEAIVDGWLHTGDIGEIDADGYVRIVDRKKDLIITAGGKNLSPANIERALKATHPVIGVVVAIGDRRPYITALLTLDVVALGEWAREHGRPPQDRAALVVDPELGAELAAAIAEANRSLSRVEQVKRLMILPDEWLPGGDELTPTSKVRRKAIHTKYAARLDALYSSAGLADVQVIEVAGQPQPSGPSRS